MAKSGNYQRNNIYIFVIIILVSLGSIATSKFTMEKQNIPILPGYMSLNKKEFKNLSGKHVVLICDRNSFYEKTHPYFELLKQNIIVDKIVVPPSSNQIYFLKEFLKFSTIVELDQFLSEKKVKTDYIIYDLQHIGFRDEIYNTYLKELLEFASEKNIKLIISDRQNVFISDYIDGPTVQVFKLSENKIAKIPFFHALTTGEMALLLSEEHFISADIQVILMENFFRSRKPMSFDFYTNTIGAESFVFTKFKEVQLNKYLQLFGLKTTDLFPFTEKIIELDIWGINFIKTSRNKKIGFKLKLDSDRFTNYFEFYYKFTQLLVQNREAKLNPELEQKINDFIGSHDFIESIKNGNSWEQYRQLINDYKEAFFERSRPFWFYQ